MRRRSFETDVADSSASVNNGEIVSMVMNVPTDRLLIMLIAATGFAVVVGGWVGGIVHAEATGLEEIGLRVAIGVIFLLVLLGVWHQFRSIDEESA